MIRKAAYVSLIGIVIVMVGIFALHRQLLIGPIILAISIIPVIGLYFAKRPIKGAVPDFVFGFIDTGLLTIPAICGGIQFGVIGAIIGSIIGDAITDGIAGFFEGGIADWLRSKGIEESRESITTSLGKMSGCLFGSGLVLTCALILGIKLTIN